MSIVQTALQGQILVSPAASVTGVTGVQTYQVQVSNIDKTVECRSDQTVLQACMSAGIDFPFACASGNCGVCITQIESGTVRMLPRADGPLSPSQVAENKTLACRAQPCSDLAITWLGRGRR